MRMMMEGRLFPFRVEWSVLCSLATCDAGSSRPADAQHPYQNPKAKEDYTRKET